MQRGNNNCILGGAQDVAANARMETLQIIHHYFPRDEKKMEAFIDANPGDGFVVNVKEPWNDPNDHAGYDTYLRQPEEWKTLDAFIRLCSRKGKRIWIYDEPGFPSGAAGRRVVETNPSYAVSCLACKSAETTGGTGEMLLPEGVRCWQRLSLWRRTVL